MALFIDGSTETEPLIRGGATKKKELERGTGGREVKFYSYILLFSSIL